MRINECVIQSFRVNYGKIVEQLNVRFGITQEEECVILVYKLEAVENTIQYGQTQRHQKMYYL